MYIINFKILLSLLLFNGILFSQGKNYVTIDAEDTPEDIIKKAANVTPSKRQYDWQKLELTGFIHFGINTFDNVEWGTRKTDITKFNPEEINVKQWVKVFKDAGFELIILTAKHHDGFCLWPSKYTDYNISNTPFENGNGDIVRDLSIACKEAGLKFGFYLSPWDMHEETYGTPEYNKYFLNQLNELLSNYGEISEVWFDGANGEGPNGRKQVYDWDAYYSLIRKYHPDAVIAVMGSDVRWVGTETGYGRQTEWSVLPVSSTNPDSIAAGSQKEAGFVPQNLLEEDLGSRDKLISASALMWYPAEIDVSIRPGWFYHEGEDELVKSPYELLDIYYNSVGLNGVLLLNIPPDKRGLIHDNDIKSMKGFRYLLDKTFETNLVKGAEPSASNQVKGNEAYHIFDNDPETYWTTDENISRAAIEIKLKEIQTFNTAMLQENILVGQRIESFRLEYLNGTEWKPFARGTTVGYKRLLRFPEISADKIRIVIDECRTNPTLGAFGLYKSPPEITFEPEGASFSDKISVKINSDSKNVKIFYTNDGSVPDENSNQFKDEILLNKTAVITALAVSSDGNRGLPVSALFSKARYDIEYKSLYDQKYPGHGVYTLVDEVSGSVNFRDGKWLGYNGTDLDVMIDLRESQGIRSIGAGFLRDVNSFIFLPESVEYLVSNDGKNFSSAGEIKNDVQQNDNRIIKKTFEVKTGGTSARYVRVKAKNIGVCPEWHKGAGEKAWLFADEIIVK